MPKNIPPLTIFRTYQYHLVTRSFIHRVAQSPRKPKNNSRFYKDHSCSLKFNHNIRVVFRVDLQTKQHKKISVTICQARSDYAITD